MFDFNFVNSMTIIPSGHWSLETIDRYIKTFTGPIFTEWIFFQYTYNWMWNWLKSFSTYSVPALRSTYLRFNRFKHRYWSFCPLLEITHLNIDPYYHSLRCQSQWAHCIIRYYNRGINAIVFLCNAWNILQENIKTERKR